LGRLAFVLFGVACVASGAVADAVPVAPATSGVVASITDGDTLRLRDGHRVRLLQIDTPELGAGECYSRAARKALLTLTPIGSKVVLETDPALDKVDRYGRLLRYLRRGDINVNLELVRRGDAAPYFYRGERGRYARALMSAALNAKAAKKGLWRACPATTLDPDHTVETGASGPPTATAPPSEKCDPNYSGGCVPPFPPDLDCSDIVALGIPTPVRVVGSDPHRLDGDHDGLGCEADFGASPPPPASDGGSTSCDPSYSGGCVPPYPPDLDCADLRAMGIPLPVRVVGNDPHRLDGDRDGLGCE
jgi:micrococcal nuclease